MAANRIVLVVDFQSQNATNSINTLNQSIGQIGTTSVQASNQASQGIKGFSLAIDQASRSVSTLVASLTGLGLAAIGREWLKLADDITAAKFALTSAFGPEAANMIQSQMRSLAHEAGLSQAELLKNAQTLGAVFRVPAEQIPGLMNVLVNFTRHLGKGQEDLNTLVQIVGQSMAKQFVTFRELANKFEAAGVDAVGIFMKITGKSRLELQKVLKGNEQDIKASMTQLLLAMQAQSAGAAAAFVQAVPAAQFQQVMDELRDLGLKAFVALRPQIEKAIEGLKTMIAVVVGLTDAFEKADEPTKNFIKDMAALVAILLVLPTVIAAITSIWSGLVAVFTAVSTVIGGLAAAFRALLVVWEAIEIVTAAWAAILAAPEAAVIALVAAILTVIAVFTKFTLFDGALRLIGDAWDWIKKKAEGAAEAIKKSYDAVKQFLGLGSTGTGIGENVEEHQRALEESQQSLFQAEQRNLKAGLDGIAALDLAYQEHLIKAKGYIDAEANYRLELAVEVDTEIKKRQDESRKAAEKSAQELMRLHRQVAIAAAEVTPDDTFAGQARLATIKAQAHREELAEDARAQVQRINDQLSRDRQSAIAEGAVAKQSAYEINLNVQRLNEIAQTQRVAINDKATEAITEHDLQAQRDLNKLKLAQEQQYRDERLGDELDMIQKQSQLEIAYTRASDAQTLTAKRAQIQAVEDLEEQQIALTRRAQLTAAQEAFDAYQQTHSDFTAGVEEEARKLARTQVQIERDASAQIQMDRLEAWRSTNEVIIEEQKKVYEGMKSTVEKIFDAFTTKGKSVWESVGNALKSAITGAMKEAVSSQVAAGLTQAITGKAVTFPGGVRRFFGRAPEFEGAGPRPELQPLNAQVQSTMQPLTLAGTDLSTAAGLLVNSASALTAAAGAIIGGGGGSGDAAAVQSAIQTVQSAQTQGQIGAASLSGRAISSATSATGTVPTVSLPPGGTGGGFIPGMPPVTGVYQPDPGLLAAATGGGNFNAQLPAMAKTLSTSQQTIARMKDQFNIGKPITVADGTFDANGNAIPAGGTIPWASATTAQKMGAVLKSPMAAQIGMTAGSMLAMAGIQRGGPAGGAETIAGTTMMGVAAASMFPALGLTSLGGGLLGAGAGIMAYGLQRGGKVGAALSTGGGALAGAIIGTAIFPGLGTAAGALIGAGVGAAAGLLRMAFPTLMERIRSEVKRVYGVDIPQTSIRKQIADIINQKYGGNLSIGIYSQEVQDIVRLYSISTGQSQAGLPRPMYSASFAQSGAGGLQIQPVYSGGQLVNNPYVGTTNTQLSNALFTNPAVYMQLHPQQAADLFAGQVVKVLGNNPGSVAAANTSAAKNGTSRTTQASALMEPLTVTR
jgi:hypothetical protein